MKMNTSPCRYQTVRTTLASDARGAIQYDGEINDKALPYPIDSIKSDLKEALPSLYFMHD